MYSELKVVAVFETCHSYNSLYKYSYQYCVLWLFSHSVLFQNAWLTLCRWKWKPPIKLTKNMFWHNW